MSKRERTLVLVLPVIALIAIFWFMLLAPKRHEASKLGDEVKTLQHSVDQAKQDLAAASQAKSGYRDYYAQLIGLGKVVPEDPDTAALIVQLNRLAHKSHVDFTTVELSQQGSVTTSAPVDTQQNGNSSSSSKGSTDNKQASSSEGNAAPTEAAAATLPLGAAVGAAGFPAMPYKLTFTGSYFNIADFVRRVDRMVLARGNSIVARGRLLTIDGFSLQPVSKGRTPRLEADFAVTSYLTPSTEGVDAGATPTSPAATPGSVQPVSTSGGTP